MITNPGVYNDMHARTRGEPQAGGSLRTGMHSLGNIRENGVLFEADNKTINKQMRFKRQKEARNNMPGERVASCIWKPIRSVVEVWKKDNISPAHYRNIFTCGSVWMCPVCSAKITEKRRVELQEAIAQAKIKGLSVYMLSLTVSHHKEDTVNQVLDLIQKASRKLKSGRFWKNISSKFGIVGSVTALEVTFSKANGTHAHKHLLLFSKVRIDHGELSELKGILTEKYLKIVNKLGGFADDDHGLDIKAGDDYIAEYIAKYGHDPKEEYKYSKISRELTSWQNKTGSTKYNHYHAFQLLDLSAEGDLWARGLFIEYAQAFKGRKQLTWSNGLREFLGLEKEKDDQEIVEMEKSDQEYFAGFKNNEFKKVRNDPFIVLELARIHDQNEFKVLMKDLFNADVMVERVIEYRDG